MKGDLKFSILNFKFRKFFRLENQTKKHRHLKSPLNDRGITIIEALMVMAVIGFIMSLIATLAYFGVTAWQKQSTRLQLESQAQSFMYILTEKLRQAQPGTVSISNYSGEMNESLITFTMVGQTNPVSIYLKTTTGTGGAEDRKIWMFEPSSTGTYLPGGQMLASNVISLYFTYPSSSDSQRVIASISLQKYPLKNKAPVTYADQETIYIRD